MTDIKQSQNKRTVTLPYGAEATVEQERWCHGMPVEMRAVYKLTDECALWHRDHSCWRALRVCGDASKLHSVNWWTPDTAIPMLAEKDPTLYEHLAKHYPPTAEVMGRMLNSDGYNTQWYESSLAVGCGIHGGRTNDVLAYEREENVWEVRSLRGAWTHIQPHDVLQKVKEELSATERWLSKAASVNPEAKPLPDQLLDMSFREVLSRKTGIAKGCKVTECSASSLLTGGFPRLELRMEIGGMPLEQLNKICAVVRGEVE